MLGAMLSSGLIGLFLLAWWLSRRRDRPTRPPGWFHGFWLNAGRSLWGWNACYTLAGAGITYAMVASGVDRAVQDLFQRLDPMGPFWPRMALAVGNFWHVAAALWLFLVQEGRPAVVSAR